MAGLAESAERFNSLGEIMHEKWMCRDLLSTEEKNYKWIRLGKGNGIIVLLQSLAPVEASRPQLLLWPMHSDAFRGGHPHGLGKRLCPRLRLPPAAIALERRPPGAAKVSVHMGQLRLLMLWLMGRQMVLMHVPSPWSGDTGGKRTEM